MGLSFLNRFVISAHPPPLPPGDDVLWNYKTTWVTLHNGFSSWIIMAVPSILPDSQSVSSPLLPIMPQDYLRRQGKKRREERLECTLRRLWSLTCEHILRLTRNRVNHILRAACIKEGGNGYGRTGRQGINHALTKSTVDHRTIIQADGALRLLLLFFKEKTSRKMRNIWKISR